MAAELGLKETASLAVHAAKEELADLSGEIWKYPELAFEEHKAHELLTSFLEKKDFAVERSFLGIETAFRATAGSGKPNVCVICEYDALPDIGHACGHNLIAEAGVAAGLGVKAALETCGAPAGTLTVMGTPAEEEGGGKISLIDKGGFGDIDIAMMVHPAPYTVIKPDFVAFAAYTASFTGKAAHASTHPWEGVNALDAAVIAYNSLAVLRQQIKPDWRVHTIITNGGTKANIIPEKAAMDVWFRAPTRDDIEVLKLKVKACIEGAAQATGCQYSFDPDFVYENLRSNNVLAGLYAENLRKRGFTDFLDSFRETGSTDMGNVSHVVPSIHPMIKIGTGEVYHTRDFTSITNLPASHETALLFAEAMAHTCIDVLTNRDVWQAVKLEFDDATTQCL